MNGRRTKYLRRLSRLYRDPERAGPALAAQWRPYHERPGASITRPMLPRPREVRWWQRWARRLRARGVGGAVR